MRPPPRRVWGDGEGRALIAEEMIGRHPDIVVAQVPVARLRLGLGAETDVADDLDAGGIGRHDEHRHALIGRDVGVGDHHHDEEGGVAGVRGEPLLAVDDTFVAVPPSVGDEQGGVGACVRLGHRVAGRNLAVEQRLQEPGFLPWGAVVGQDLGVARVRRLTTEHRRRPRRSTKQLVQQGQLDLAVPLASELGSEVAGPQRLIPDLLLKRPDGVHGDVVALVVGIPQEQIEGFDLLAEEAVDPVELGLELWFSFEIPHGTI